MTRSSIRRVMRRPIASAIIVVIAYVLLAMVSGRMSPFARGPLLDGLGPAQPYRWVNPPADLAATNVKPSEGVFSLQMGPKGVLGLVLVTSDNQVTIVVDDATIPPHKGDRSVKFLAMPVDASTLSPPPGSGVVTFGNAYRLSASYEPSGTPVTSLAKPIDVILAHPVTKTLKPTALDIYLSPDGSAWTKLDSRDSGVAQQVEAPSVANLGYLQVAGVPAPIPLDTVPSSGGSNAIAIAIGVGAVCLLLIGIGLLIRSRR
jgi:hypothetical protein